MELYRLSRKKFSDSLSDKGAALKGVRWNSVGVELIYTASNRSLAMAEVAVHFSLATLPDDYVMMTVFVPDNVASTTILETDLPANWKDFPHPNSTQKFGDDFVLENKYCLLRIPSVVTEGDFNFLINPNHREFKRIEVIEIEVFTFDKRIFK